MTDVGNQASGTSRVSCFLVRALVVLGGAVAATAMAWSADNVTRADASVPENSAGSATSVEIDQPPSPMLSQAEDRARVVIRRALPETVTPSLSHAAESVRAFDPRTVVPLTYLGSVVKPAAGIVTSVAASAHRVTALTVDDPMPQRPSEVVRDHIGDVMAVGTGSGPVPAVAGLPAQGGAADASESADSPCLRHFAGGDSSSMPPHVYPRISAHDGRDFVPPWSPLSACGASTSAAVVNGGDHRVSATMPGRSASSARPSPRNCDFGRQATRATAIRPGVTPG